MRELPRAASSSVCALGLCGDERRARVALSPPAADVSAQPPCRAAWRLDLEFDLEFADVARFLRFWDGTDGTLRMETSQEGVGFRVLRPDESIT